MLSDTIVEFLYHTCVLWIWSTAIMIAITLVVEALLPVEFESGTQFQILLLIFFILNALRMELRGVDVSAESAAAPAKAKDVVTPCKPTVIIRDCDHSAKDLEIETLKAAKAELETSIAEERKSTFDTEEQRKLQQERADEFSWKLQCTKERCAAEYRTHMDRILALKEVNDELCDARQVIRMQKKNVESSESLSRYWKKESWKYKDEAKTYYYQAQKYMADLIAAEKKLKKADRDRVARETESNNVYEINSREIRKLKYKVKDLERAAAQELTQIAAKLMQIAPITTIDSPPALPAKENMQVTLGTTIDILPTPAPEPAKPSEHSSGSAANPSTIAGRKIAKPVSRAGKAKPRTARDEIDLLVEYFKQATADRKKAPSKELKYDIIFQMSKITNVFESGNLEDVEWALDALTSISFDVASGNTTFPEFMADMAVALCDQLEDYLEQQSDENQGQEENGECDEGDGDEGNKGEDKDKYKDQSKADEEEESEEE